jgi:hypothetical protein
MAFFIQGFLMILRDFQKYIQMKTFKILPIRSKKNASNESTIHEKKTQSKTIKGADSNSEVSFKKRLTDVSYLRF